MVENENDAVIVRSTIDLAHNLGLKVIAEGVETRDAWHILGMLGCDCSQGYFRQADANGKAAGMAAGIGVVKRSGRRIVRAVGVDK